VATKKNWLPNGIAIKLFQSPNLVASKIFGYHKKEVCHMFLENFQLIEGFPKTYDMSPFLSDQKNLIAI
jgi:hypothetical protein